jgi:hypothetical protein
MAAQVARGGDCEKPSYDGNRLMRDLPRSLRIAGYDITIEEWNHHAAQASSRYGEFSSIEQTIRVSDKIVNLPKRVDTVLHEIHHAIWWAYGIHDRDNQERIVSVLGTAWMQIWRDNPALVEWLSASTRLMNGAAPIQEAPKASGKELR